MKTVGEIVTLNAQVVSTGNIEGVSGQTLQLRIGPVEGGIILNNVPESLVNEANPFGRTDAEPTPDKQEQEAKDFNEAPATHKKK